MSTMLRRTTSLTKLPVYTCSLRSKASGVKIIDTSADMLPYKGKPADIRPVKIKLEAGKTYSWCSCGLSVTQPFCDGTHKINGLTDVRPIKFQVEKTGEYLMCNCKQTTTRPICDRTHKDIDRTPKDFNNSRMVMFGDPSPVYEGVAHKLGYKPKNGGFQ